MGKELEQSRQEVARLRAGRQRGSLPSPATLRVFAVRYLARALEAGGTLAAEAKALGGGAPGGARVRQRQLGPTALQYATRIAASSSARGARVAWFPSTRAREDVEGVLKRIRMSPLRSERQRLEAVIMPVEFRRGCPQTVRLDRSFRGFAQTRSFAKLRPEFRTSPTAITLPTDQFRYDKLVPDKAIAVCGPTQLQEPQDPLDEWAPSDQGNAIVVVLESPHEEEYGPDFTPLGPLRRPSSRTRLRGQLPRLLQEAELDWAAVAGSEVILANPVQLQASLHRLMQPNYQTLQHGVRNQVWRALYYLPEIQCDFIQRIMFYRPALIINACTSDLQDEVQTTLEHLRYTVRKVNQHASVRGSNTRFI